MAAPWPLRVRYLRLLAVGTIVSPEPIAEGGLEDAGTADVGGDRVHLYRVKDMLPDVLPISRRLQTLPLHLRCPRRPEAKKPSIAGRLRKSIFIF